MKSTSSSSLVEVILVGLVLMGGVDLGFGQRVAPGVPPQHYQQPPPHQQQQQQFQQVPQHQQQFQGHPPPPQHQQFAPGVPHQQQVQQPMQHQPPQQMQHGQPPQQMQHGQPPPPQHGQGHGHGHEHGQAKSLLDASNVGVERQHIQEHMDVPIDTSQMSEQELQFHYFKMHDADNNNKLDGCELVKSLIHWHDSSNHDHRSGAPIPEAKIFTDQELINLIDPILQNDDRNHDGFIDYSEFSLAQAAAAKKAKAP